MTSEVRDEYGLTESERYETLLQTMGDHHEGKHDWSSVDPYDCVVCHAVISLYTDVVRANAAHRPDDALRVAALEVSAAFDKFGAELELVNAIMHLRAALDGAPYEPSEETVEDAAAAAFNTYHEGDPGFHLWRLAHQQTWRSVARSALRAAYGSAAAS